MWTEVSELHNPATKLVENFNIPLGMWTAVDNRNNCPRFVHNSLCKSKIKVIS